MEASKKVVPFRSPHRDRRRMGIFLSILGVLVLILIFFALDEGRNWDAVRRFLSYGNEALSISLSSPADTAGEMDGSLVLVGRDGVTLYDRDGKTRFVVAASFSAPVVHTTDDSILVYDGGGTELALLDSSGKVLLENSVTGALFDVDLSTDGAVACTYAGNREKTLLQVFDQKQVPCYTVYSATRFLTTCAVSVGAEYVCAVALGELEGGFQSSAVLYRTDREEPTAEVPLGNQLIYDMRFWGDDLICALGENNMIVFNTEGKIVGSYAYPGLASYSLDGDSFAVLTVRSGSQYRLVTVNRKGKELGSMELGQSPASVDVNGKYVAVLQNGTLTVCGKKLDVWYTAEDYTGDRIQITEIGAIYVIQNQTVQRYLP